MKEKIILSQVDRSIVAAIVRRSEDDVTRELERMGATNQRILERLIREHDRKSHLALLNRGPEGEAEGSAGAVRQFFENWNVRAY